MLKEWRIAAYPYLGVAETKKESSSADGERDQASPGEDRRRPLELRPAGPEGHLAERGLPGGGGHTLDRRDIRIFDYVKQFALPFREAFRARINLEDSFGDLEREAEARPRG